MRIVLTGGGTGGHVYPALSVATALRRMPVDVELLYLGGPGGAERQLVSQFGIEFRAVRSGQLRGRSLGRLTAGGINLARGIVEGRNALLSFKPNAVFATGGYASMPVVLAAGLCRIPVTVFLPDVYPGWAVRGAVQIASRVATTTDGALAHLPRGKTTVTGYPLRPQFHQAHRAGARERFGLGTGPVLLISGASSGSRILNNAVLAQLPALLACCEVLHLTGVADERRVTAAATQLSTELRARYHIAGYIDEMAWAMAAADLSIMRAGASCLAEPPALGLPAILVPGTFSDQHRNAAYMEAAGAAVVLPEARLDSLATLVHELFQAEPQLRSMGDAARALARPLAAEELAALLLGTEFKTERLGEACLP